MNNRAQHQDGTPENPGRAAQQFTTLPLDSRESEFFSGNCPMIGETQALQLIQELEERKLEQQRGHV